MSGRYDAIVIGLGGMGAAALATLARRGRRVLGIEQFALGHTLGSSHGHTRVIRTAYFEHPAYVPLCQAAFHRWRELERRAGSTLLVDSPCLSIGRPDGELIGGVRAAAAEHRLSVDSLSATALRERFPQFHFDETYEGVLERDAGFLFVDRCVRALLADARSAGAEILDNQPVAGWNADGERAFVTTARGEYQADGLVIAAGPWASQLLGPVGAPLRVMRQVVHWFEPASLDEFRAGSFPIFLADTPEGCFYSIPATDGRGLKVAQHYGAAELRLPEQVDRQIAADEFRPIRRFLREHLPDADIEPRESSVCLYTLSPDRHFMIDQLSGPGRVVIAAGFSGHGFKFAPVVGEMLADLLDGKTGCVPDLFRLNSADRRLQMMPS